ncbi:MAG TPA: hypothetical protein PKD72_05140, partial [Gemmatales bacterium]|nr:hypothetical protein [Gemmatales bacterium]
MPNNYDWTYAGFFTIATPTEVSSLTGYFVVPPAGFFGAGDPAAPFNPAQAEFQMEIWSDAPVAGGSRPTNT